MPSKEELRIAKKVWDKVFGQEWTVESMDYYRKKEGKQYIVKKNGDKWSCNCPSFIFHSGTCSVRIKGGNLIKDSCKHIRFIMEKEGIKYVKYW